MNSEMYSFAGPDQRLLEWLRSHDVDYQLRRHAFTFSARETARAEGVAPETFAKVVGVRTRDGHDALMILGAPDHLDLRKAAAVLGVEHARLMTEEELDAVAREADIGAVPAVGDLFALPTFADYAVRDDPAISFNAGSHRFSVRVDRKSWERATGVVYADLAENVDREPAWFRS
jgi:Ala-tRNA(Pro) deacylase